MIAANFPRDGGTHERVERVVAQKAGHLLLVGIARPDVTPNERAGVGVFGDRLLLHFLNYRSTFIHNLVPSNSVTVHAA